MLLGILGFIKDVFTPASELIDDVHTSDEERLQLRNALAKIEQATTAKVIEYESKLLDLKTKIILAEATSDNWLVSSWRPLTMLAFVGIVISYWFGYQPVNMTQETLGDVFSLIKIGLGGYVAGRSIEKSVKIYKS